MEIIQRRVLVIVNGAGVGIGIVVLVVLCAISSNADLIGSGLTAICVLNFLF